MSKHGVIKRYILEIEKINYGQYPSFNQIKDYLFEYGFEVSDRTIQRDIEQIKFEFGIEIKYNRTKNGYYINFEESINVESFFRLLEIVNTAELLINSVKETKETLKYISFDKEGNLKGIKNLSLLLNAVKNHKKISFIHYNYQTGKKRNYILKPYLLKEYENRWYIVGIIGNLKEFRIFGIDRIESLKIKPDTFSIDRKLNPFDIFENTIGLIYTHHPLQTVVLSFLPSQANYIKSLPLHHSQKILIDNEEEFCISITVTPNYELEQLILKYGHTVSVKEPKWLAIKIKSQLQKALNRYV